KGCVMTALKVPSRFILESNGAAVQRSGISWNRSFAQFEQLHPLSTFHCVRGFGSSPVPRKNGPDLLFENENSFNHPSREERTGRNSRTSLAERDCHRTLPAINSCCTSSCF